MKENDNIKVIKLEEVDVGYGIEIGTTGTIVKEDELNCYNGLEEDDVFYVKLNSKITGDPLNLEDDGSYQFYRNQIEVI